MVTVKAVQNTNSEELRRLQSGAANTRTWNAAARLKCCLAEYQAGKAVAVTALDVRQAKVLAAGSPGRLLIEATERLAVQYGILNLDWSAPSSAAVDALLAAGYQRDANRMQFTRAFPRRRTRYLKHIQVLLKDLDLPVDYGRRYRLPLQLEAGKLTSIGKDIYERQQHLLPGAAQAWKAMQSGAERDGVTLQAVSAFRSVEYQAGIIRRKRQQGQDTVQILNTSAAPGFSEHHSARAIDISTPGFDVLEEVFEESPAFEWLTEHAASYGFSMSFPRNNLHGVAYEPWHWAWNSVQ